MPTDVVDDGSERTYQEREAVAVFSDERALNAAVDELMQAGLRQDDMSLLAHGDRLKGSAGKTAAELEDSPDTARATFVSSDSRTGGLAAIASGPALLAGLGAAAVIGTGGAALIPTLAFAAGGSVAGGAVGLVLARAFGRKHAAEVERQLSAGGLLLWVHAPDPAKDSTILDILRRNGGSDVHIHVMTRTWGISDVPLYDAQPDPLLK